MKALPQVVVILLLGIVAGCREAERLPPVRPDRAAEPRQEAQQNSKPAFERRLAGPGELLEADLANGEAHFYRLDLMAGQYAEVTLDQRGVDVDVVLRAPDGRQLRRVDSMTGDHGPEPLPFIAEQAGAYRVEVHSLDARARGSYTIVLGALRPASPDDRSLVAAESTFAAGEELRRKGGGPALRQAMEHHRRALDLFQSSGATDREAEVLLSLGLTYSQLGDSTQARGAYASALGLFRAAGRTRQLPPALIGLGRAYRRLGDSDEAIRCYREALTLSREAGSRWDEVDSLVNLGKVYDTLGRVEEALAAYEQALYGWRELGVAGEQAATLDQLGQLYLKLGDERQAIDRFEEALGILGKAGKAPSGTIVESLGSAYVRIGQHAKGIEHLQRALRLHRQAGNQRDEAVALHNLGLAHRHTGRLEQARRYYAMALGLHRALGNRGEEVITLLNLGGVYVDLGDPAAAIGYYQSALPWFVAAADQALEAAVLFGLARARRQQGELVAARDAIENALERIESLRTKPAETELRASYFASKQQYFAFYIDLLMEVHRLHPGGGHNVDAFEASERVRVRTLLEDLAEGETRRSHSPLAEEVAELARRLHDLELQRLELVAAGAPAELLDSVERELRRVLARHRRVRAAWRGGRGAQAKPLQLELIQRRVLDGETLLLEYFLGEKRSFLWAVTSASLESFELPGRATIEAAARRALELLPESHQRTARARTEIALQDLSRLLLAPVGDRLAGRRLVVVADGVLNYIPFGALPVPVATAGAGRRADGGIVPLIVEHEVVSLPSASMVAVLRQRHSGRPRASATVAVLADPVFGTWDPRVEKASSRPVGPGRDLRARRFPRLPFSRQEAEGILALVPAGQGLRLVGFDASRMTAESGSLAHYRYVHFATHGILDTTYPELSGLVLSLVDRHGRAENGFLWAHEIADLQLGADLVGLSACQTALGKEIRGEGLVGLTRAFLDAGTKAVLVSLWQVEDRATAELMRRLYKRMLQEGLPPSAALRQAQVSLWQEDDWRAPYYWGGIVLQGEWR